MDAEVGTRGLPGPEAIQSVELGLETYRAARIKSVELGLETYRAARKNTLGMHIWPSTCITRELLVSYLADVPFF